MTQLSTFSGRTLPDAYAHQIRSFIRIHWDDPYVVDPAAPLVPEDRHPQHVVAGEREALFSSARVTWVPFTHDGHEYRLYCLGDVFTYPAFRRQGLGEAVTTAGTSLIRSDADADLAILFCDPSLAGFYARHGWEGAPGLRAEAGDGADGYRLEGLPMLLRLSARATRLPVEGPAVWKLPGHGW
jgi:GNAT superfamily N-acetyltransferase